MKELRYKFSMFSPEGEKCSEPEPLNGGGTRRRSWRWIYSIFQPLGIRIRFSERQNSAMSRAFTSGIFEVPSLFVIDLTFPLSMCYACLKMRSRVYPGFITSPRGPTNQSTVKSSNFVILLSENIFFLQNFLRLPYNFFWYWNLYRRGLCILLKPVWLWTMASLRNFVFSEGDEIRRPSLNFVTL